MQAKDYERLRKKNFKKTLFFQGFPEGYETTGKIKWCPRGAIKSAVETRV